MSAETLTRKLQRETEADERIALPRDGATPVTPVFVPRTDLVEVEVEVEAT